MTDTLQVIAKSIASVSGIDAGEVTLDKHIFEDLGVDSLDFLDIVFDLDQAFGIKLPVEEWLAEVEQDRDLAGKLFSISNLVTYIESGRLAPA